MATVSAGRSSSTTIIGLSENPSIRHLWPIWQVLFPQDAGRVGGRPVVSLTLAVNYALGGMNVWGYHAVNLAIHILAAWTLLGVVRRTLLLPPLPRTVRTGRHAAGPGRGHALDAPPLQTEAVTYVIQRTEALAGLFYLLVLYCVIRGADFRPPDVLVRRGRARLRAGHGHQGSDGHRAAARAALRPDFSGRLVSQRPCGGDTACTWPWPPLGAWSWPC